MGKLKTAITKWLIDKDIVTAAFNPGQLASSSSFAIYNKSKHLDASKAMAEYRGWVYAATRAIAEELASLEFYLMRTNKGQVEQVDDDPILRMLWAPNKYQTGYDLRYLTAINLVMSGNAYWYLEGVKSETSKPTAIHFIPSKNVKIKRGGITEPIKEYQIKEDNYYKIYQPYEIFHLKLPDPNDPTEGIGVVEAVAEWIDMDNAAARMNTAFFKNGVRLGGFLESESALTPDQLKFLQKSFMEAYGGVDQAYSVSALPKGTKFVEGQVGPKDIDYPNGSKEFRDKILAGFRVPKTILGVAESETNRATAETAEYVFANRTIKPLMELIITQLNEFFVPRFTDTMFLTYQDPTPIDKTQQLAEIQAGISTQPFISHNEAREMLFKLPPMEGGDDVRGNTMQYQPIGAVQQKQVARQVIKSQSKSRAAINAETRRSIAEEIVEKAMEQAKEEEVKIKEAKLIARKNILELSDDQFEPIWKAFANRVEPWEKRMAKIINDFNAKQEKEVIKNIEEATKAINNADLFDKKEWVNVLVKLATPLMVQLYEQEHKEATELLGFDDVTGLTKEAKKALEDGMKLMATSYNDTTLDILKSKLSQGLADGMGFLELKKQIKEIYEFSNDVRAGQVARSEVFRAANYATKQAWADTGVVKTIKWYTAADERVCEYCGPMHGEIIDIEEDFFKKGDTITGSEGNDLDLSYSDVGAPPLHANCRCYVRPETIEVRGVEKPKEEIKPEEKIIEPKKTEKPLVDQLKAVDEELDNLLETL